MEKIDMENNYFTVENAPKEKIYPPHSVRIYPRPFYEAVAPQKVEEEVFEEQEVCETPEIERPHTKVQAKIDAMQEKLDAERAKLNAKLDIKQEKIDFLQKKEDEKNARLLLKRQKKKRK